MSRGRVATDSAAFPGTTVRLLASLLVWAAHLGAIYAATSLACARGSSGAGLLGPGPLPWIIGLATLVALAALALLTAAAFRSARGGDAGAHATSTFLDWLAAALGALAAVAVIWQALPALIVPPCA